MSDPDAHLLIVDDDERIRGLLQKFLMRHGFLVTAARDAAHARRILAGLDFDMIVMDVMMPGEDGVSLTRDLRKTSTTPILLLTARARRRIGSKGLRRAPMTILPSRLNPRNCCSVSTQSSAACLKRRQQILPLKFCISAPCAMISSVVRCGMAMILSV
jgi:CheY-like chemotaxis protein